MLIQDLYKVEQLNKLSEKDYKVYVRLNKNSEVFKGHFPGNPVMPGVCMMQMIKELTERILDCKLFMTQSSNVKFMALINPEVTPLLMLSLEITTTEQDVIKVKNQTMLEDTVALKLSNTYKIITP